MGIEEGFLGTSELNYPLDLFVAILVQPLLRSSDLAYIVGRESEQN